MAENMELKCFEVGMIGTNCYVLHAGEMTIMIDPGDEAARITAGLSSLDFILLTHAHWDHMLALKEVSAMFPRAKLCVHSEALYSREQQLALMNRMHPLLKVRFSHFFENLPPVSVHINDGDSIGPLEVLHCPGHSPGSVCYYSQQDKVIFSGDTLFASGYGRTDLPRGSQGLIEKSLARIDAEIPHETKLYPGHGPGSSVGEALAFIL